MVKNMNKAIASFVIGISLVSLVLYTSVFSGSDLKEGDLAPNFGEHSLEILAEAGIDEETIKQMIESKATLVSD